MITPKDLRKMERSRTGRDYDGRELQQLFAESTGWTVSVESGVGQFLVTEDVSSTAWYTILTSILENNGLCWGTNSVTHAIVVKVCEE